MSTLFILQLVTATMDFIYTLLVVLHSLVCWASSAEIRTLFFPLAGRSQSITSSTPIETYLRSKIECAWMCYDQSACVGFGYRETGGPYGYCAIAGDSLTFEDETDALVALNVYRLKGMLIIPL